MIAKCEGSRGGRDFFLPVGACADYKRSRVLKYPGAAVPRSPSAAAREPAEVLQVKREGRGQVQVRLESHQLLLAVKFAHEPEHRHLDGRHFHQHASALKQAATQAQWDLESRGRKPADAKDLSVTSQDRLE